MLKYKDAQVRKLSEFKIKNQGLDEWEGRYLPSESYPESAPTQILNFKKGEAIMRSGDLPTSGYYITKGSFHLMSDGNQIHTLSVDSVLGEMGALFNRPMSVDVVAAEESTVLEVQNLANKLQMTRQVQERAFQEP